MNVSAHPAATALSAAVIVSGLVIAGVMHEWQRLLVASLGGLA